MPKGMFGGLMPVLEKGSLDILCYEAKAHLV